MKLTPTNLQFGAVYSATVNPKKEAVDEQVLQVQEMMKMADAFASLKGEKPQSQEVDRAAIEKNFDETLGQMLQEGIKLQLGKHFKMNEAEVKETLDKSTEIGKLEILNTKNGSVDTNQDIKSFVITGEDLKKVIEMLTAKLQPKA